MAKLGSFPTINREVISREESNTIYVFIGGAQQQEHECFAIQTGMFCIQILKNIARICFFQALNQLQVASYNFSRGREENEQVL